jgi:signal transduction histidine kinase
MLPGELRLRVSTCLLVLLGAAALVPPAGAADPDDLLSGYSLTSWNDGDGRPLGSVHAVVQGDDGYLWVGSDAGLFRFDGSRFTAWAEIGDTPLPRGPVTALYVDRDGNLWAGFAEGGTIRRLRERRVQDAPPLPDPSGPVTDFTQGTDGTMWTIGNRVLYRLEAGGWTRVKLPWPDREGSVLQPYVSRNGDLWIPTRWGVFRRRSGTETFELLSHEYVYSVSEDPAGQIWTTDIARGFTKLGGSVEGSAAFEGAGFRLLHDRKGNLWIATFGKGLWYFAAGSAPGAVKRVTRRNGLFSDAVQALAEDREGNIWIGTTGGLHRLTEHVLTPLDNVGFVVSVEAHSDEHVWGATSNGVVRFSSTPTEALPESIGSRGLDVRDLYSDPRGPLWVGATDGLWRVDADRLSRVASPERIPAPVMGIAPHAESGLWLFDGDWLFHWDGAHATPLDLPDLRRTGARVTTARADREGRVWIAFTAGQIGFLERDGAFRLLGPADGLAPGTHDTISTIFQDAAGVIWIGGSGGLSRVAGERVATLAHDAAFPGARIWAIVEDAQGFFWLSVDRGVVRVAKNEIEAALTDASYRMSFRLFDPLDGLAGSAVGIVESIRAPDDTVWFVRGGGVTLIDPAERARDLQPPEPTPVRIESVEADDLRLAPTPDRTLAAGTTRLQISYTALTLASSNDVRFRYRLDGFDTEWVEAGSRRTAFYTNLSPGSYTFHVEAASDDGALQDAAAVWTFRVLPAFYETIWFTALSVTAIALAVWLAWRVRLELMKKQFALALTERMRLSREIHDTLLQSMVGIALQLDDVSEGVSRASPGSREQLVRIRRRVEAFVREARQSIWDLRSSRLETTDLFSALKEFGRLAVTDRPVRFIAGSSGTPFALPPGTQNQLLRIGQEAITNAVRHAKPARIQLDLTFEQAAVVLRVTDDGSGFEIHGEDPGAHYGLTTMRERAEELGGRLHIETSARQGTIVEARIPRPADAARRETESMA